MPRQNQKLSILIVEENDDLSVMTSLVLTARGHQVFTAHNIRSSVAIAREFPIDLVVCDWALPDGTGADLMRKLRLEHNLKGILLTAMSNDQISPGWRQAGFVRRIDRFTPLHAVGIFIEDAMLPTTIPQ